MKWTRIGGLVVTVGMLGAGSVWMGCGGDDSTGAPTTDSGAGQDTSMGGGDSGGMTDSGNPMMDGGADTGSDTGPVMGVDAAVLDCTYYCSNIAAACTGTNQQYLNNTVCMAMCAGIGNDAGAGQTSGGSLSCRMTHLALAASSTASAATECPHAGPYGYGVCGTICDNFCKEYFAGGSPCKTDTANGYANADACKIYCNGAAGGDASAGAPGTAQTTPSVLCREYHLENAYNAGGTGGGHCDHAGANGAGVCN
ncbi:MAG: hypothetical protein ABIP89_17620 [Polyangiaceae bacterium]